MLRMRGFEPHRQQQIFCSNPTSFLYAVDAGEWDLALETLWECDCCKAMYIGCAMRVWKWYGCTCVL